MSRSLFINGQWRPGHGPALTSIDPATGEAVWQESTAAAADVAAAVSAAREAFQDWADRPRAERIETMRRYKAALEAPIRRMHARLHAVPLRGCCA